MSSGEYSLIPREPHQLHWKQGPLPRPTLGLSVVLFHPHSDLRCAPQLMQLVAEPEEETSEPVWRYIEGLIFRGDVAPEDWWAVLGPDPDVMIG